MDECAKRCGAVREGTAVPMHRAAASRLDHAMSLDVVANLGQCPLSHMVSAPHAQNLPHGLRIFNHVGSWADAAGWADTAG